MTDQRKTRALKLMEDLEAMNVEAESVAIELKTMAEQKQAIDLQMETVRKRGGTVQKKRWEKHQELMGLLGKEVDLFVLGCGYE